MYFKINTDGASRGNPGPASFGFVIRDDKGDLVYKEGKCIGIATNNIAEYNAVLKSFEYIFTNFKLKTPHQIDLITDSQLVASQLNGKFKIKNPGLIIIFDQIKVLELKLGNINYRNVPRAQNSEADEMANLALDNNLR